MMHDAIIWIIRIDLSDVISKGIWKFNNSGRAVEVLSLRP